MHSMAAPTHRKLSGCANRLTNANVAAYSDRARAGFLKSKLVKIAREIDDLVTSSIYDRAMRNVGLLCAVLLSMVMAACGGGFSRAPIDVPPPIAHFTATPVPTPTASPTVAPTSSPTSGPPSYSQKLNLPIYGVSMNGGSPVDLNETGVSGNISVWIDHPEVLTATWQGGARPYLHLVAVTNPSVGKVNVVLTDGNGAGFDIPVTLSDTPPAPTVYANPAYLDMQPNASQTITLVNGTTNVATAAGCASVSASAPWIVTGTCSGFAEVTFGSSNVHVDAAVGPQP